MDSDINPYEVTQPLEDGKTTHPNAATLERDRLLACTLAAVFGEQLDVHIGRYRVETQLGSGGMGVVYLAVDEQLARKVALKLLRADAGDKARRRFIREAQALARVNHPNVVSVYEIGEAEHETFIAMEYVRGSTLREWLLQPHSRAAILDVFEAAGQGLAAAHARGVIHRDFKPGNVMVADDGRVLVVDFGLAKAEIESGAMTDGVRTAALLERMTTDGRVMGSPGYMAPEQFDGFEATARTDQFGFCVALWEALYGQRPFPGDTVLELSCAVSTGALCIPSDTRDVPRWQQEVLRRGLAADPEARWASIEALLDALRRAPVEPASSPPQSRRANTKIVAVLVALILALLVVLALTLAG